MLVGITITLNPMPCDWSVCRNGGDKSVSRLQLVQKYSAVEKSKYVLQRGRYVSDHIISCSCSPRSARHAQYRRAINIIYKIWVYSLLHMVHHFLLTCAQWTPLVNHDNQRLHGSSFPFIVQNYLRFRFNGNNPLDTLDWMMCGHL